SNSLIVLVGEVEGPRRQGRRPGQERPGEKARRTGGQIRFTLTGKSLQLFVGGTLAVSMNDSSITAAGRVGIRGTAGTVFSSFSA
ncbi:MAG TPA: hypothetical protein VKT80_00035, partial [Chloroflexota bacterium]|nr:hypothetical protein [Chloroflexota bacterium]